MRRICIAIVLFLCMFVGCASVRTVGTQQIDAVIGSGILDSDKPVTSEDKRLIRSALESARADIVTAETQRVAAEKRADSNAAWASRGKWGAGILIGVFALGVAGAILKFLGKFPIP